MHDIAAWVVHEAAKPPSKPAARAATKPAAKPRAAEAQPAATAPQRSASAAAKRSVSAPAASRAAPAAPVPKAPVPKAPAPKVPAPAAVPKPAAAVQDGSGAATSAPRAGLGVPRKPLAAVLQAQQGGGSGAAAAPRLGGLLNLMQGALRFCFAGCTQHEHRDLAMTHACHLPACRRGPHPRAATHQVTWRSSRGFRITNFQQTCMHTTPRRDSPAEPKRYVDSVGFHCMQRL